MPVPTRLLVTFLACAALLWAAPRARGLAPGAVGLALQALLSASLFVALAAGLAGVPAGPRGTAARRLGLGPGRVPRWSVALLCVGSLALSSALDAAIRMLELKGQGQLGAIERQLEGTRGPELAFALLAIAIGSALAEELFFRGLVQRALERGLARALPRAAGALAVTGGALAFAAAHGDRIHSPAALVLGLYFGTMTWLARSVRAAAVCHVVNNTAAVLGLALAADQTGSPEVRIAAGAAVAAAALALAFRAARAAGGTDPVAPGPPAPFSGGPDRPTGEP